MSFVSWAFVALFLAVLVTRLTIGRRKIEVPYVVALVAASTVFYSWHVPAYLGILLFSSVVDFWAALGLTRPGRSTGARRAILVVSLCTNLGLLAWFKYAGFFLQVARDVGGAYLPLSLTPDLDLVLPMGISFYTFQSMSYTIDVYRGELRPIRRFWPFFLFVSFFPQLVAGPIVRAAEFLPQLPRPRRLRRAVVYEGLWLIVLGFFLKVVCADNLAVYVDEYWGRAADERTASGVAIWAALMFSGQIYADFAAYSHIARGTAYLLGFRLPVNFDAPYIASSFKNFWERWHITLSRWLRDYLYISLGGNRHGRVRTYVNLLLVMLLGGLWHGAAYTFVIWGALHGVALGVERLLGLHQARGWTARLPVRVAWAMLVQLVVLVSWVYFRSQSAGEAQRILANAAAFDGLALGTVEAVGALFLVPLLLIHAHAWLTERGIVDRPGPLMRASLAAGMLYGMLTLYAGTADFIYFQF